VEHEVGRFVEKGFAVIVFGREYEFDRFFADFADNFIKAPIEHATDVRFEGMICALVMNHRLEFSQIILAMGFADPTGDCADAKAAREAVPSRNAWAEKGFHRRKGAKGWKDL